MTQELTQDDLDLMSGDDFPGVPTPRPHTALAPVGPDPFAAYASTARKTGTYLSFSKIGEWEAGKDGKVLKEGTRLVAYMPGFRIGWRRWGDSGPPEDITELLATNPKIQTRSQLGDLDQTLWKRTNADGSPQDPWEYVNIVELSDGETTYIYTTKSNGGKAELQKLCGKYSDGSRSRPGMLPIIQLESRSYRHSNPQFGKIFAPVLPIVGWTDAENPSLDGADDDAVPFSPAPALAIGERDQRVVNPTQGAARSAESVMPSAAGSSILATRSRSKTQF